MLKDQTQTLFLCAAHLGPEVYRIMKAHKTMMGEIKDLAV